jgi:hypothetical protein
VKLSFSTRLNWSNAPGLTSLISRAVSASAWPAASPAPSPRVLTGTSMKAVSRQAIVNSTVSSRSVGFFQLESGPNTSSAFASAASRNSTIPMIRSTRPRSTRRAWMPPPPPAHCPGAFPGPG